MRDKTTAAFLAAFLGSFGVHKFYLGDKKKGMSRLWMMLIGLVAIDFLVPIMVIYAVIDAVALFGMTDNEFDRKYNGGEQSQDRRRNTDFDRRRQRRTERARRPVERQRERKREYTKPKSRAKVNPFKISGIKKFKDYDYDGAIEDFTKALDIDSQDAAVHFNLACAYSLTEDTKKSFYHLDRAVANGFNDFDKIKTHDALAFLRIQDDFEAFAQNSFRLKATEKKNEKSAERSQGLLEQLNKLNELKERGLLTEAEFLVQKEKLLR